MEYKSGPAHGAATGRTALRTFRGTRGMFYCQTCRRIRALDFVRECEMCDGGRRQKPAQSQPKRRSSIAKTLDQIDAILGVQEENRPPP